MKYLVIFFHGKYLKAQSKRIHHHLGDTSMDTEPKEKELIVEIKGKDAFDAAKASTKITVFDFTATWCGPCKATRPILEDLASEYEKKQAEVKFFSIDIDDDDNKPMDEHFNIKAVPTVVFLKNGEYKNNKLVGLRNKQDYQDTIEKMLKEKPPKK